MDKTLKKAFTQEDGETLTDPREHNPSDVPESLMAWGASYLVPMKSDEIKIFKLGDKTIKVRKIMEDLYSGWIEDKYKKIHAFEKLTMPILLTQMQSKLEMYSKESEKSNEINTTDDERSGGVVAEVETKQQALEEEKELTDIGAKLQDLKEKVQEFQEEEQEEHQEIIDGKDLKLESPETICPACENPVEDCVCYTGLDKPRVEFDGKKLTIFFKSGWNEEDRLNFRHDIINRAGRILRERLIKKAGSALDDINKRIGR
jgi:hypothetical protein